MAKIRLTSPTFSAASKTVTHASFSDVTLAGIQLITNVTDQIIIYNFADSTKGGTLAGDVLTLEYDTTSMSDTDELMVLVEDGVATVAVTQSGTWDEVGINDSGNSITVDNAQLSVVGSGTEATAMRVTIATDSTGVLSVDDNGSTLSVDDGGGAITVDGSLTSAGNVTNAGTFVVQENGAALTALQLIDDMISTDDGAASIGRKVSMVGFLYDDTTPDSVDEGDGGMGRMSANRNQYVQIRDNAGNERGLNIDANGELGVSAIRSALPAGTNAIGKLAANNGVDIGDVDVTSIVPGTGASNLGKAEDAAHTTGDVGVMALGVIKTDNTAVAAEADYAAISLSSRGTIQTAQYVDSTPSSLILDNDNGGLLSGGDTAHDSADAGRPLKIGGKAYSSTPTAVTANDRVNAYFDLRGRQQITPAYPEQDLATEATTHVKKYYTNAGAVTDGIIWSPAAGKRWFVTDIIINVSAAATVTLEDALTAGDSAVMKFELAANSGITHSFATPLFSGEDAADLLVTTSAGNVYITVTGYEI